MIKNSPSFHPKSHNAESSKIEVAGDKSVSQDTIAHYVGIVVKEYGDTLRFLAKR
jgi:hypothetical protein